MLATLAAEFPTLQDFERDFPSLCFALATGVGKTRLMGAFIAYLHLAYGIANFFVLAPNLTIYDKLKADFTPNTRKYVFKGIAEFAANSPIVITGDDYDQRDVVSGGLLGTVRINIFNISKINSEVRGGKEPRIKRMREVLGDSYFNHLAALPDLVLLMDESHRYRAGAGVRAINELNPLFGLELTATPFVESARGPVPFRNVVVDYPLAKAMEDGVPLVKPFMLVIARDTTHAAKLRELIESDAFHGGRYRDKVIQVDSSKSGADEEEMIRRLLAVESVNGCLYPLQKFHSGTERTLALILDRDSERWFRPAKGQFQIYYKHGTEQPEYVPDFVAEMADDILMIEAKASDEMAAVDVLAKASAAVAWCARAFVYNAGIGAKPWRYLLVPHDAATEAARVGDFMRFVRQTA